MKGKALFVLLALIAATAPVFGGNSNPELHALPAIVRGNLTIFPVVGYAAGDTSRLLTLDEGLREGTVIVTETGMTRGLVRGRRHPEPSGEVNRLVLVNNSDRPLLLLAGEVVTGGKQDRVIGMDAIVPPFSKPIDLSVFCVEHGRWTSKSDQFGSLSSQMVQPSVRAPAMADRDQEAVWDNVAKSNRSLSEKVAGAAPALRGTTSYADAMSLPSVKTRVSATLGDYETIRQELRKAGARGVVVAFNGSVQWADIFGSSTLLQKYWEKLVRSYAAEALTNSGIAGHASQQQAQQFLDQLGGNREVVETEPGVYRRAEISGDGYKVFTLVTLESKPAFAVHIAKLRVEEESSAKIQPTGLLRR